jgi:predicted transcriptional regulator
MHGHLVIPVILHRVKTAVSVPDDVYDRAEQAARRLGLNRSQLYTEALNRFLLGLETDPVTQRLDELADDLSDEHAARMSSAAARRLIDAGGWQW